ncbi:MAG: alpha-amylase family glycosyl hydrolase [Methylococcales bacterium]
MKIYNLFPLLAGNFAQWAPHMERAADMGFDWIFVNPIQKTGESGSLYSTADYFQINPLLVDSTSRKKPETQLKNVIAQAEKLGIHMMVDLVINHCAVDSDLVTKKPEWFVRDPGGGIAHPFCMEDGNKVIWRDLASFDHEHTSDAEGLYKYFYDIVEHLIKLGFHGFRCDAAYQVPTQLWHRLISDIKKNYPDTLFTAETLGCTPDQTVATANGGFDFVYNSSKWWDFSSPWLMEQYALISATVPSISFPESHDTPRLLEDFDGNVDALKQRYLFSAIFSAGIMMPIGYEFGFRKALHVVNTRPHDWEETSIDLTGFIKDVNALKTNHPLFLEDGHSEILNYDNPAILLMWKASRKTQDEALFILNKDPWTRQHFYSDDLYNFVQSRKPLIDISPEYAMDYLPAPFDFELAPGMGRVFVTSRD